MQYFSFQWHITEECDQRCKHCYIFSQDQGKNIDRMDFLQMMETLKNIEDFCETFGREPYLFLTGGDPILHSDFWKLMEEYRQFDRFTKCSKCKLLAWCRGCPAVAKGTNGSFYAEDPQCWMMKMSSGWHLQTGHCFLRIGSFR